ncbi:PREDICTED: LOW QUALITY PROTEIN: uncharacterized protein LOC106329781 [Brassica oleracea var. oleracea]|uniref:LOW QUALITY PROTEIN: uncharacterized protein LOC106329781 n=1 Tax=Brassica oleracea var. oleracea TaxID=109376 RepID=UPI0006A6C997|nr:PREDICTED: LOW QUALITY PROTEIN: uncharacterized protein LOC106329781 [Brassica oleracea var. oleracea]
MKSIFNHEHVSTSTTVNDRVINGCFLRKTTTKELIYLKAFQVQSDSISFAIQETCLYDQIMIVLSEMYLPPSTQERPFS